LLSSLYRRHLLQRTVVIREGVSSTAGTERNRRIARQSITTVVRDLPSLGFAFRRAAERIERRAAQEFEPRQQPEDMDHPASVLSLSQMTRHIVAAREQGHGGGRRIERLWLRTSAFDLPASSGYRLGPLGE